MNGASIKKKRHVEHEDGTALELGPVDGAGVAAGHHRCGVAGRGVGVDADGVEGAVDFPGVAAHPGSEHGVELVSRLGGIFDSTFEQLSLRCFGKDVEEAELLAIGLQLLDRLARPREGVARR